MVVTIEIGVQPDPTPDQHGRNWRPPVSGHLNHCRLTAESVAETVSTSTDTIGAAAAVSEWSDLATAAFQPQEGANDTSANRKRT